MSKSSRLREAARLAVETVCAEVGVHAACPIAQAIIELSESRRRPEVPEEPKVGSRDRAAKPEFKFPKVYPIGIAPYIVRRAIVQAMTGHAMKGVVVGAGGRVVQSIVTRMAAGGQRRRLKGPAGPGRPPGDMVG